MLTILSIVAPVFILIGSGYLAARSGRLPEAGIDGLIAFVTRFAVPCLLFLSMYRVAIGEVFEPLMLVSFYAGAFLSYAVAHTAAWALGRRPGEAVGIGFSALFSNTLLIGLPIMIRAYGEAAAQPALAIIAVHAPLLYTFGMVMMEMARQGGDGAAAALKRAARSVIQNALMIGIALGLFFNLAGLPLPGPIEDAAEMLKQATLPAALFALGGALTRYKLQADLGWALGVSALLLLAHPAATWFLSDVVFGLSEAYVRAAVVVSSMPAGLNVYVFAAMYKRAEGVAASTVLLSTALSVVTISLWLAMLGGAA